MKILVTGGAGFLGKAVVKKLLNEKHTVVSISRSFYPELEKLNVSQIKKSLNDLTLDDLEGIEAVIHTAAIAGVWGKKEDYYKTNYEGTKHLVDLCLQKEIKYFVYTSSPSVVFGKDDIEGLDESIPYPEKFYTYYQETKKLAEEYVLSKASNDFLCVSIRPHLIWGPEDPHLFPRILERARLGKLKQVGSGENLVDIVYVDNAALAHVLALTSLQTKPELSGNAYFIGQERPVNLWNFLQEVLRQANLDPELDRVSFKLAYFVGFIFEKVFKLLGINKPEPPMTRFVAMQLAKSHYFSHQKAIDDFGYKIEVTIEEGLSEYFKIQKANKKLTQNFLSK